MKKFIFLFIFLFVLYSCSELNENNNKENLNQINDKKSLNEVDKTEKKEFIFSEDGLKTNTAKSSIKLDLILDGGPGKDGIPAINNPKFLSISESKSAMKYLNDDEQGIVVSRNGENRFYPFSILVWHEIVNDNIGNNKFAVTFCPLCGSSIVFDRVVNGKELYFGVSGKLYESNMLMYDNKTESLWSQSLGKVVTGDMLGSELEVVEGNVLTFGAFTELFPAGKVISDETGFNRNYGVIPYGNYDESDILYFPVQNTDASFHKKEMFYIVNHSGKSIAFHLQDLVKKGQANLQVGDKIYNAKYDKGLIEVNLDGKIIPGYYEMWFSFITHNIGNKNIWSK